MTTAMPCPSAFAGPASVRPGDPDAEPHERGGTEGIAPAASAPSAAPASGVKKRSPLRKPDGTLRPITALARIVREIKCLNYREHHLLCIIIVLLNNKTCRIDGGHSKRAITVPQFAKILGGSKSTVHRALSVLAVPDRLRDETDEEYAARYARSANVLLVHRHRIGKRNLPSTYELLPEAIDALPDVRPAAWGPEPRLGGSLTRPELVKVAKRTARTLRAILKHTFASDEERDRFEEELDALLDPLLAKYGIEIEPIEVLGEGVEVQETAGAEPERLSGRIRSGAEGAANSSRSQHDPGTDRGGVTSDAPTSGRSTVQSSEPLSSRVSSDRASATNSSESLTHRGTARGGVSNGQGPSDGRTAAPRTDPSCSRVSSDLLSDTNDANQLLFPFTGTPGVSRPEPAPVDLGPVGTEPIGGSGAQVVPFVVPGEPKHARKNKQAKRDAATPPPKPTPLSHREPEIEPLSEKDLQRLEFARGVMKGPLCSARAFCESVLNFMAKDSRHRLSDGQRGRLDEIEAEHAGKAERGPGGPGPVKARISARQEFPSGYFADLAARGV